MRFFPDNSLRRACQALRAASRSWRCAAASLASAFGSGAALSITGAAAVGVTGALAGAAFSWAWAKALVRRQVLQLTWPTSLEPFTLLSPRPQAAWPDSLKKCVTI